MDLTDGELSLESINLYGATDLTGQRRYKGGGEEDVYYLKDHLGNIRTILKDEKNNPAFSNKIRAEQFSLLSARDYFPFGSTMRSSNFGVKADLDKWRYQGKERDAETGYDYFEARYYDKDLGRFLQRDPMGELFSYQNFYTAMDNDPINLIDPTGMASEESDRFKMETSELRSEIHHPDGTITLLNDGKFDIIKVDEDGNVTERQKDVLDREKHSNDIAQAFWSDTHENYREHVSEENRLWLSAKRYEPQGMEQEILIPFGKQLKLLLALLAGQTVEMSIAKLARKLGVEESAIAAASTFLAIRKLQFKDAIKKAEKLGYKKTNYRSHGQPVYKKGNRYITPDIDGHSGGTWKMADSPKNLGSKKTRMGTYDSDLNKIGN